MSVELWKSIFDWATVVLIGFTVVSGAGALITGDIISKRQESKLRQFDKDLTDARTELGKQQERAATAEHDAAEAKTTAATANERTLTLQKAADDAKAAQQKVEIELAIQRERAAKAERDLIEVRKRQEPRQLFASDVEKFKAFLTGKPKSPVMISCIYGDREGCAFAGQVRNVLVSAGWDVSPVSAKALEGNPSGISLHVPSGNKNLPMLPDPIPVGAGVLVDAFREVLGIELDRRFPIMMSLPPGTIEIFVGYR